MFPFWTWPRNVPAQSGCSAGRASLGWPGLDAAKTRGQTHAPDSKAAWKRMEKVASLKPRRERGWCEREAGVPAWRGACRGATGGSQPGPARASWGRFEPHRANQGCPEPPSRGHRAAGYSRGSGPCQRRSLFHEASIRRSHASKHHTTATKPRSIMRIPSSPLWPMPFLGWSGVVWLPGGLGLGCGWLSLSPPSGLGVRKDRQTHANTWTSHLTISPSCIDRPSHVAPASESHSIGHSLGLPSSTLARSPPPGPPSPHSILPNSPPPSSFFHTSPKVPSSL